MDAAGSRTSRLGDGSLFELLGVELAS